MKNIFKTTFVLYSDKVKTMKQYEKINGEWIKIENPIPQNSIGVYKHSFVSPLKTVIFNYECLCQILRFERFNYSMDNHFNNGTKFNIFTLPFVYLFATIDTGKFNKIKFING